MSTNQARVLIIDSLACAFLLTVAGCAWIPGAYSTDDPRLKIPGTEFRDELKDHSKGPLMVVIPSGRFEMGSNENEDGHEEHEAPAHTVSIDDAFALSQFEITVAEFAKFVKATGYMTDAEGFGGESRECAMLTEIRSIWHWEWEGGGTWRNPGFSQEGNHPVVCVSWYDAKAYVRWLATETGKEYRLPSEAELEYAIRAGTIGEFPWDKAESQCQYANGGDLSFSKIYPDASGIARCNDEFVYTAPIGQYNANQFNLFDTVGNVAEWAEDCWHINYEGAPDDGSAWLDRWFQEEDCGHRVVRGGAWDQKPGGLRSAHRGGMPKHKGIASIGIRLARDLR